MALKRNLIANYLGHAWTALMGLAFIPLYIHYLGIEAYGLIGLFATLQVWLGLLDMGLTPALGREMGRFTGGGHTPQSIRNLLRSVEVVAGTMLLVIVAVGSVAAGWGARHWLKVQNIPVDVVAQALVIMALVIALRLMEGIYRSSMVGLQQQVMLNLASSGLATLRWAGTVGVLAWVSPTAQAFFLWQGFS
jgi:O-antigen/teichoic acid export membrane protein